VDETCLLMTAAVLVSVAPALLKRYAVAGCMYAWPQQVIRRWQQSSSLSAAYPSQLVWQVLCQPGRWSEQDPRDVMHRWMGMWTIVQSQ